MGPIDRSVTLILTKIKEDSSDEDRSLHEAGS